MKKAIVTGATGFIGKFLVRELVNQNVEVIAVVRRGTKNLNTINVLPVKIVAVSYTHLDVYKRQPVLSVPQI